MRPTEQAAVSIDWNDPKRRGNPFEAAKCQATRESAAQAGNCSFNANGNSDARGCAAHYKQKQGQGTQAHRRVAVRCQPQTQGCGEVRSDLLVRRLREAHAGARFVQRSLPATKARAGTQAAESAMPVRRTRLAKVKAMNDVASGMTYQAAAASQARPVRYDNRVERCQRRTPADGQASSSSDADMRRSRSCSARRANRIPARLMVESQERQLADLRASLLAAQESSRSPISATLTDARARQANQATRFRIFARHDGRSVTCTSRESRTWRRFSDRMASRYRTVCHRRLVRNWT